MSFQIQNRRYTGSKTKIAKYINNIIEEDCLDCSSFCDLFAGTGVISSSQVNSFEEKASSVCYKL